MIWDWVNRFIQTWGIWIAALYMALHIGQLKLRVNKLEEEQK